MTSRLMEEVSRSRAKFVIIDLTGVDIIDTHTADHFIKLVRSVELLGAQCVLTGIRPAVAQAMVSLDTGFGGLTTLHNLKHGLRACMRSLDDAEG
jgi:rsbT co-antagonist protein RsbR